MASISTFHTFCTKVFYQGVAGCLSYGMLYVIHHFDETTLASRA
jgi:hypothetical protein